MTTSHFDDENFTDAVVASGVWKYPKQLSECIDNYYKKQRLEEIKQLAKDIFIHNNCAMNPDYAWKESEKFYKHAKQKEREMIDEQHN